MNASLACPGVKVTMLFPPVTGLVYHGTSLFLSCVIQGRCCVAMELDNRTENAFKTLAANLLAQRNKPDIDETPKMHTFARVETVAQFQILLWNLLERIRCSVTVDWTHVDSRVVSFISVDL